MSCSYSICVGPQCREMGKDWGKCPGSDTYPVHHMPKKETIIEMMRRLQVTNP